MASSKTIFWTTSPGTTVVASATAASAGTERGRTLPSPKASGTKYCRGAKTMS
jgi:hypothetical protein